MLIRTSHDEITNYMYSYTEPLIKHAEKCGFSVHTIEGSDINFKNIEKRIGKLKPKCIVFNGHGSPRSLYDNSKNGCIDVDKSHIFKKTIAFVRACNALSGLGPAAIKEGCFAFIGYKNRFWLAWKHGMESRPLNDPIAKPILNTSNSVVIELLKGGTVEDSVDKSHKVAAELIMKLLFSNDPYARVALRPLIRNDGSLDFEGNPNAKLI